MTARRGTLTLAVVVLGLSLAACSGASGTSDGAAHETAAGSTPTNSTHPTPAGSTPHSSAHPTPAGSTPLGSAHPTPAGSTPHSSDHPTPAAGPSRADIDTCALITQDEAAAALGEPVRPGERDQDNPTACAWQATKDLPVEMIYVDLQPQFDRIYDHIGDAQLTAHFILTKVPGIGDEAYTQSTKGDTTGSNVADIFAVKKDGVALSFGVVRGSLTKAQGFAADKVLAQHALSRL